MTQSDKCIAVTGATGFIGARLCARLVNAGFALRALTRSPRQGEPGIEWVHGDLGNRRALERLVADTAVVVHCAGAVRGATAEAFQGPNVDGVAALLAATAAVNKSVRFMHVSTLAAREPQLSHYAASKRAGEQLVVAAPLRSVVIRPPAVYGPGDRELLPLLKGLYRGRGVIPANRGRFSLICVDDLVDAVIACVVDAGADGSCYEIHDGKPGGYAWDEVIEAIAELRGGPVTAVRIPRVVLGAAAGLGTLACRLVGRAPMLTPGKVRELFHPDWVCSNEAFGTRTGWVPRIDLAAGLRMTLGDGRALGAAA
jgi:2-alkyl-3-oxoalkanoate reductase